MKPGTKSGGRVDSDIAEWRATDVGRIVVYRHRRAQSGELDEVAREAGVSARDKCAIPKR
jgi:hypothetical protein